MAPNLLKEKIIQLEAEVRILKTVVSTPTNFDIDGVNWEKIKPALKKARRQVSTETYG